MVNDSELVKIRLENYSTTWSTQTCYVRLMPLSHDKRVQLTYNQYVSYALLSLAGKQSNYVPVTKSIGQKGDWFTSFQILLFKKLQFLWVHNICKIWEISCKIDIFVNNRLIKIWIQKSFAHMWDINVIYICMSYMSHINIWFTSHFIFQLFTCRFPFKNGICTVKLPSCT